MVYTDGRGWGKGGVGRRLEVACDNTNPASCSACYRTGGRTGGLEKAKNQARFAAKKQQAFYKRKAAIRRYERRYLGG